jgi:hypothetical protein
MYGCQRGITSLPQEFAFVAGAEAAAFQLGHFPQYFRLQPLQVLCSHPAQFGRMDAGHYVKGHAMFRFDQLIRRDMIVRDVKQRHPETIAVFDSFGFRSACDDCDIETLARKHGLSSADIVEALNRAIYGSAATQT